MRFWHSDTNIWMQKAFTHTLVQTIQWISIRLFSDRCTRRTHCLRPHANSINHFRVLNVIPIRTIWIFRFRFPIVGSTFHRCSCDHNHKSFFHRLWIHITFVFINFETFTKWIESERLLFARIEKVKKKLVFKESDEENMHFPLI